MNAAVLGGYALVVLLSGGGAAQNLEATESNVRRSPGLRGEGRSQAIEITPSSAKSFLIDSALSGLAISLAILLIQNRRLKQEIQQRQQAEFRFQASEKRYEALVAAVPTGIFCCDAAGQFSYVNERWCQITGQMPVSVSDSSWQQTLHPEDRPEVTAKWAQAMQTNGSTQMEYRIRRPDGTDVWVYGLTVAEYDITGQVIGYVGTLTDIDDRKRSEEALQQREAHYRALVSILPDLLMRISRAGIFLEFLASPNFRVLGEPADWIGTHISETLPPNIAQERLAIIEQVLQTQTMQVYEQDFSIDGIIQIEEVRVVPYGKDEALFLVRDVSDRKQAEKALKQSEVTSQAILAAIPDYLVCVGADGIYRHLVVPERDFALVPPPDLAGQSLGEVLPPDVADQHLHYLYEAMRTGEVQVFEQVLQIGNHTQEEEVRVVKSGPDEALFIVRDIGDRKRAEKTLQQKLQQEQAFNRVVQAMRNSLDLATVFATATAETAQLMAGLNCAVVQYLPDRGVWKIINRVCPDPDQPNWVGFEVSDSENPFADRLKQQQIVRVEDTREIENVTNQPAAEAMPGAWLMIPLAIDNEIWGSLSLSVSQQPFRWEDGFVSLVQAIADQLEVAIQQAQLYHQVEQEKQRLIESQKVLTQAQQMAQLGNWEIDVATQTMTWSDTLFRMFGVDTHPVTDLAEIMLTYIHPEDQPRVKQAIARTMIEGIPYEIDLRILRADGSIAYLESRAEAVRDEQERIVKVFGTSLDISDRKQAEATITKSEVRYRKVVEAQTDFILRSLPDTTITFANSSLCQVLGVSPPEMVGRKWSDFADPEDLKKSTFQSLAELCPEQPRFFVENRDRRADGQIGWTQWLNEGIFDGLGQLVEIQSVGRDITQLKQVEQALRESKERLRLVTENMSDLVCLHHPDGRYLYVTPSSQSLLGYSPAELIGQDPYSLFHPDDCDRITVNHQLAQKGIPPRIAYRIRKQSGEYIWLESLTRPIFDQQGQLVHLQTTSRDVSDRVKVEEQLKHDALHDGLTGLPNRLLLLERLNLSLQRVRRSADYQFAVLFLDLDNFKVINDSQGHLVGDELLGVVANLLTAIIRETDVATRIGGDEFVVLLDGLTSIREAENIAERVLEALKSPFQLASQEVFIGTSIGIVVGTAGYDQAEELLRDSDLAMYWAKHRGRGCYAVFDPAMRLKAVQRMTVENELRKALENDEFVLYYQPIIYLKTRVIQGFEALVRWQHPQRGLVSPTEFIEIAEETGLIEAIGERVLHKACQQLAIWQAQFPAQGLKISVNLSVKQLQNSLLPKLDTVLATFPIAPGSLVLEITESMLVQNIDVTVQLLEQIKSRNVRISIDDFGTGYSSLSYLHQLPVDSLKIDRAFVSPPGPGDRNRVIAESIIALSDLLAITAIAEGIETAQQLAWLQAFGCESGQGYFFSPPLPVDQATQHLHKGISS
ncbi:MAG: PAS domain S-box protein [Phormidesmis sp.]